MKDREQAIRDMQKARDIHAEWVEWEESDPEAAAQEVAPVVETAGDANWHRGWIARYDRVIKILQEAK